MREAVGSTFLFNLMIVFIFFFAAFLAIAINYSQAFNIKNRIINIIEQNEGTSDESKEDIVNAISASGYYREVRCNCDQDFNCGGDYTDSNLNGGSVSYNGRSAKGLCVRRIDTGDGVYYGVNTFVSFNLPIIGNLITFPVKGETKIITNEVQ